MFVGLCFFHTTTDRNIFYIHLYVITTIGTNIDYFLSRNEIENRKKFSHKYTHERNHAPILVRCS